MITKNQFDGQPLNNNVMVNDDKRIPMNPIDLSELMQKLQYKFNNTDFLEESLRHSSFVNEQGQPAMRDNERLEFIGDAVLNLIVGHLLMIYFPELKEGELSRMRANLVNESRLAEVARESDLGTYIKFGKGEMQTDGCNKQSILAGTYEALIAAVYLDGGFNTAFQIIENKFSALIRSDGASMANQDYKSQLQELVQTSQMHMPIYKVIQETGPDHDKTFRVQVVASDLKVEGEGKSKKIAEQDAARNALEILKKQRVTQEKA